jgi:hypothetical protein
MTPASVFTMVTLLFIAWGGFIFCLILAIRKEHKKKAIMKSIKD